MGFNFLFNRSSQKLPASEVSRGARQFGSLETLALSCSFFCGSCEKPNLEQENAEGAKPLAAVHSPEQLEDLTVSFDRNNGGLHQSEISFPLSSLPQSPLSESSATEVTTQERKTGPPTRVKPYWKISEGELQDRRKEGSAAVEASYKLLNELRRYTDHPNNVTVPVELLDDIDTFFVAEGYSRYRRNVQADRAVDMLLEMYSLSHRKTLEEFEAYSGEEHLFLVHDAATAEQARNMVGRWLSNILQTFPDNSEFEASQRGRYQLYFLAGAILLADGGREVQQGIEMMEELSRSVRIDEVERRFIDRMLERISIQKSANEALE